MTRKNRALLGLAILTLVLVSTPALAKDRPVQLALFTPIQIFPEDDSITGIRLNLIYGRNASFTGVDVGLVNHTTEGTSKGLQLGVLGMADSDFVGWQDSAVNVVQGDFEGFQWGLVNYAGSAKGLQLGFVNYVERMHGLQIGLVNIIKHDGAFPVLPIVNWSF